jgi:hypothetical protein
LQIGLLEFGTLTNSITLATTQSGVASLVDSLNTRAKLQVGALEVGTGTNNTTIYNTASGIVSFSSFVDPSIDLPLVDWFVPIYSSNASSVFITENYADDIDNFVVLFSSRVDVIEASEEVLKKSFNRTSPAFRWHRDRILPEVLTGLAVFDF